MLRRELFSSCEVVERFLESHWWEKTPRLVLLPFLPPIISSSDRAFFIFFLLKIRTFYFLSCVFLYLFFVPTCRWKKIFKLDKRIDLRWYTLVLTLWQAVSISVCVSWLVLMVPLPVCSPPTSLYGAVEWPWPRINAMERKEQKFFIHPPMDGWDWGQRGERGRKRERGVWTARTNMAEGKITVFGIEHQKIGSFKSASVGFVSQMNFWMQLPNFLLYIW